MLEIRRDLVTKDWVIISTDRKKRPGDFKMEISRNNEDCPFCHLEKQPKPVLLFSKGKEIKSISEDWSLAVIPNKFPAVKEGGKLNKKIQGPYEKMNGVGVHEVVITKDHNKDISQLSIKEVEEVILAFQKRYLILKSKKFINYISIFHNHGYKAGASIFHPHSQIMGLPVLDIDARKNLIGSRQYWELHHKCVYCEMIKWDKKDNKRVIYENDEFIAICPFASHRDFEIKIYPKEHLSNFEEITEKQRKYLAEVLLRSLVKLRKALNKPDYNFFLVTAPCDGNDYSYFHWHFNILPRTCFYAALELGAGIEVSTIKPEEAAKKLKKY